MASSSEHHHHHDHVPGTMDISAQEKTFERTMKFMAIIAVHCMIILLALWIFRT